MLRFLFAAVVMCACTCTVAWYALIQTVHMGTLSVPDLRGLSVPEAQQLAHDQGLAVELDEPGVYSAQLPPGSVASQEPHPGFHVKSGSVVRVRMSLGSKRVYVPTLRDESLQGAISSLERVGLQAGTRAMLRGQGRGDGVVATDPPRGSAVPPESEVKLLVNISPRQSLWVMPSFLSQPIGVVRSFCRRHGLRLGQVHEVSYPGIASGVILRQYPAAGSPLSRSDIITTWVAS